MGRFIAWVVLVVFTTMIPAPAYAISRSSSSSSRSSFSRPSPPPSRPAPSPPPSRPAPAPRPSTPPSTPKPSPKPSPKVAWASNKKYGQTKSTKAGRRPLVSRTPKPEPHTYNGRTYRSSDAIYTNSSGKWVTYFLIGAAVGGVIAEGVGDEVHCFDEDHNEITCSRDDNSFMKDW